MSRFSCAPRGIVGLLVALALAGCESMDTSALESLPPIRGPLATASERVSGPIESRDQAPGAQVLIGRSTAVVPPRPGNAAPGDVSLDFADTDIREVVAQILGTLLRTNYTIDPAVRGTATLRTATPIARAELIGTLQALLAQNGATLVQASGLYRVLPAAASGPILAGQAGAGGMVVPLRYASAEDLAKTLQAFVGNGSKLVADPGRNVLLVSGEAQAREALLALIQAFDINLLAGQSYALFPVTSGGAKDFAVELGVAFRSNAGSALANVVRVVPMERINAVLLVSSQERYIEDARQVYALLERGRRATQRGWNVYYLQNSRSNDIAYVLQQAFTPNHVTAVPSARATGTTPSGRRGGSGSDGISGSGFNSGTGGGGGIRRGGGGPGGGAGGGLSQQAVTTQIDPAQPPVNPLLGGLDPGGTSSSGSAGTSDDPTAIKIIPNAQNNALLIYATAQERDTILAMMRKVDILPLQVRIDATIAEVTLNDALRYGTQFFFKSGINGALNFSPVGTAANSLANALPGFVLSGPDNGNAALNALQAVTTVKVLSSPQILVLDNEAARLQVGNLVPYLTSSSQSTITSNAPVINSIDYRETGVIMDVTPRVNSGGLVTLDISQEVSDVDNTANNNGINSPTFLQRIVSSRVVVQDGQTVGLAGLIRDSSSRDNRGIPFLKDLPILGLLAGKQDNQRTRTELLVLVTPHVVHDQRDARALTEDLRDQLINAAKVPDELGRVRPTGSADPSAPLRRKLRLGQ
jgi:general secretion pathway protein D